MGSGGAVCPGARALLGVLRGCAGRGGRGLHRPAAAGWSVFSEKPIDRRSWRPKLTAAHPAPEPAWGPHGLALPSLLKTGISKSLSEPFGSRRPLRTSAPLSGPCLLSAPCHGLEVSADAEMAPTQHMQLSCAVRPPLGLPCGLPAASPTRSLPARPPRQAPRRDSVVFTVSAENVWGVSVRTQLGEVA